jgi:hypothetical protein
MTDFGKNIFSETGGLNWSPKLSYHYAIAFGNMPFKEVHVTKAPATKLEAWHPLWPWEYVYKFPFYFDQLLPAEVAKQKGLTPVITFDQDVDKKGEEKSKDVQKMCIVSRFEKDQYYLLDNEIHPIFVDIFNEDGAGMRFIFNYSIKTLDELEILRQYPAGNYLVVASKKIKQEMHSRFVEKGLDQLNGSKEKCLPQIIATIKEELNKQFVPKGFSLDDVVEEFFFPYSKTQELIDMRVDKSKNDVENIIKINTADTDASVLKTKGNAETEVQVKRTKEIGAINVGIFQKKAVAATDMVVKIKKQVNPTEVQVAEKMSNLKGTYFAGGSGGGNNGNGVNTTEIAALVEALNKN